MASIVAGEASPRDRVQAQLDVDGLEHGHHAGEDAAVVRVDAEPAFFLAVGDGDHVDRALPPGGQCAGRLVGPEAEGGHRVVDAGAGGR